jgi:hypothetical protein
MAIGEFIQLFSITILAIGVMIAFYQIFLLRKQIKDQHEWYRRERGILYSSLFHPELQKTKSILEDKFDIVSRSDAIPEKEFKRKIEEQKDLRIHLNYLLTYYENVALACSKKVVDEDLLFDMMAKTLISYRKKLINYIDYRQREANNERLWNNFIQIANKWEEKLREKSVEYEKLGT